MAKATRPRVFFDANVLYSGLHSPTGAPAEVIALHAARWIDMVVSNLVLTEVFRTVRRKLPARLDELRRFLTGSPPEVVPNPSIHELRAVRGRINPDDAPIVAAALTADVEYFVTGDRRLISEIMSMNPPFSVFTPREFIDEFSDA